jgi:hypothetical protein
VRLRTTLAIVALASTSTLAYVVPASAGSSTSGAKTAKEILAITANAMLKAKSVHYDQTGSIGGSLVVTLSTDSASTKGTQTQTLDGAKETTRVVGGSLFINATKKAYSDDWGVKNSTLANRWVLVPKSNKNYASISAAILLSSLTSEFLDLSNVKIAGHATVNGAKAVTLTATVKDGASGINGSETLYVATKSPYRPIGLVVTGTDDGDKIVSEVKFSKWGEKVTVKRPTNYVTATAKTLP